MKSEYFENVQSHHKIDGCYGCMPLHLYRQERDWTCSIACLRTITSGIVDLGSEDEILKAYNIHMGPHYGKELKDLRILDGYNLEIRYGCDEKDELDISDLWKLVKDGYRVMVNWLMSYDHWTVILGYIDKGDIEHNQVIYYCPYFDEVRFTRAGDFEVMWQSGEYFTNGVKRDYIAIRQQV